MIEHWDTNSGFFMFKKNFFRDSGAFFSEHDVAAVFVFYICVSSAFIASISACVILLLFLVVAVTTPEYLP